MTDLVYSRHICASQSENGWKEEWGKCEVSRSAQFSWRNSNVSWVGARGWECNNIPPFPQLDMQDAFIVIIHFWLLDYTSPL